MLEVVEFVRLVDVREVEVVEPEFVAVVLEVAEDEELDG